MKMLKVLLIVVHAFIGITAVWGGYELIRTNGMGVPVEWLNNSFSSFLIPGTVLIGIGIINLSAAFGWLKNYTLKYHWSALGGFGIVIFEFIQLYIVQQAFWLQILYFTLGIIVIVIAMLLLHDKNKAFLKLNLAD